MKSASKSSAKTNKDNDVGEPLVLIMLIPILGGALILFFYMYLLSLDSRHNFEVTSEFFVVESFDYSLETERKLNRETDGTLTKCILPKGSRISHPVNYGRNRMLYNDASGYYNVKLPSAVNLEQTGCPSVEFTYFASSVEHLKSLWNNESLLRTR